MKQKVTYADFVAAQQKTEGTVAWFINRRIEESRKPGARPLGNSHRWILLARAKEPIGQKQIASLRTADLVEHCRMRKAGGVLPQTTKQDIAFLRSMVKYFVILEELPASAMDVFTRANPLLEKEQLIGKGQERTRRPTSEEIDRILAHIDAGTFRIPMRPIVEFQLLTARRISETCRIRWEDLDHEKKTCLVRDLKNPKGKGFSDTFPLLGRAWEIVMAQPKTDARIFPYRSASVSAAYTRIKKALGIKGLRLHDSRRDCVSRLFEEGYSVPEVSKVSLHRNPTILLKVYTQIKPEDLHKGPASKRRQEAA
jgi:integrase